MFKQFRDYLLDLDKDQVETPTKAIREFLFDIEPRIYQPELVVPISSIVDNGHPLGLGNPKILKTIFKHLPTSDLITLRRVSLRWNHISCEYLRKRLSHCKIRPSKITTFLHLMRKCFCNPFGSYAIRIERLSDPNIQAFLCNFSQEIIRLRVKISSEMIPEFTLLLHKMSSLEELHLIRIPEQAQSLRLEYLTNSVWKYGLYQFTKLRLIKFESDDPSVPFTRNYDMCLINIINSSPNIVKVEFVNWDSPISHLFHKYGLSNPKSFDGWRYSKPNPNLQLDLIDIFFKKEMKFKAIKFVIDKYVPFYLVMEFALKTSSFLYHLSLRNDSHFEVFQFTVKLPRLITLGLKGWKGPVDFQSIGENFPNLKTLKLNWCNFSHISDDKTSTTVFLSLETLNILPEIPIENCPIDAILMNKIVNMFPTITQLFVQVEANEALHVIYESLPHLELLCLDLRGDISDEGLTGIPDDLIDIRSQYECGCPAFSFPDESRRPTHIGCLEKLRVLIIGAGKNITNISLLEGISKLERLDTLWLDSSYEHGPGNHWCLRAIADSFPSLKCLVTAKDIEYSEEDLRYLRSRLPGLEFESGS